MTTTDKLLDVQHVTVEFHIGGLVGGSLLVAATPEHVAETPESYTGQHLAPVLAAAREQAYADQS